MKFSMRALFILTVFPSLVGLYPTVAFAEDASPTAVDSTTVDQTTKGVADISAEPSKPSAVDDQASAESNPEETVESESIPEEPSEADLSQNESPASDSEPTKQAEQTAETAEEIKSAGTAEKKPKLEAGIFYGHITHFAADDSLIVVTPLDDRQFRTKFYLDKYTQYYVNGARKTISDVYLADKVAVRYFAEDRLAVAEAIFVVFGDFSPKEYEKGYSRRKRWKKTAKARALKAKLGKSEGSEEKEGGKKEETKPAGH